MGGRVKREPGNEESVTCNIKTPFLTGRHSEKHSDGESVSHLSIPRSFSSFPPFSRHTALVFFLVARLALCATAPSRATKELVSLKKKKFRPDVEAVSGGGTKSVSAGAGLFTNPRIGARSSVRTSAAGEDSRKERFLRRFLPVQKAANNKRRRTTSVVQSKIYNMINRKTRLLAGRHCEGRRPVAI